MTNTNAIKQNATPVQANSLLNVLLLVAVYEIRRALK